MDDIHGGQAVWIGACQILSAVSRDLTLHVDDCGRATGRDVARGRIGVFVLSFPSRRCTVATLYTLLKIAERQG